MLKECTILTFDEIEKLKTDLDRIIEDLIKASNNDCDGIPIRKMCDYAADDLKEIREQFD